MKNFMFNIKKFLTNKNTVTILGVFLAVLVLYIGYNYRVQQAIKPRRVPYALTSIQPRQKITADMIGYADVPPAMIIGEVITDASFVVGKYANYNTMIPKGSLFFTETVISASQLPDSALLEVPTGYTALSLPVTIESTLGNSIFPGNYINLYIKALDDQGKIIVGRLIDNVKVLAVKDSAGRHVFENSSEARTPSSIIFAVPEDMHLLIRKAYYLGTVGDVGAVIIPVPNTEAYEGEPGAVKYSNQYLKTFIEVKTSFVPEDELPDLETPGTGENTDNNPAQ